MPGTTTMLAASRVVTVTSTRLSTRKVAVFELIVAWGRPPTAWSRRAVRSGLALPAGSSVLLTAGTLARHGGEARLPRAGLSGYIDGELTQQQQQRGHRQRNHRAGKSVHGRA